MAVTECKLQVPVRPSTAFPHLLVATDFSEASRRALCVAAAQTAGTQAQISLIHVLQTDGRSATLENPPELDLQRVDAEKRLQALVQDVAPGQNVNIIILTRHGPVADAVAITINESDVDLLVIGTRARGGLSKVALGSVAEELLRIVSCPVLTIGPRADIAAITHGPGFHRILFATDFGHGSIARASVRACFGQDSSCAVDPGAHDFAHAGSIHEPFGVRSGRVRNRRGAGMAGRVAQASATTIEGVPASRDWIGSGTQICRGIRFSAGGNPDCS
jgi:nucleotide-binding universal stress UspA family protein